MALVQVQNEYMMSPEYRDYVLKQGAQSQAAEPPKTPREAANEDFLDKTRGQKPGQKSVPRSVNEGKPRRNLAEMMRASMAEAGFKSDQELV